MMDTAGYHDGWVVRPPMPAAPLREKPSESDPAQRAVLRLLEPVLSAPRRLRGENIINVFTNVSPPPPLTAAEILSYLMAGDAATPNLASAPAPIDVPANFRTSGPPDRLQDAIKRHAGGRPRGWRKGRLLSHQEYLDWYQGYALEPDPPTLEDLAEFLKVSPDTAARRVRSAKLPWPPEQHLDIWDPDE
jgi:hypothetical protein